MLISPVMLVDPSVHTLNRPSPSRRLLVLHAVWLAPADETQAGNLLVWAEQGVSPEQRMEQPRPRGVHPFSATPTEIIKRLPGLNHAVLSGRRLVLPEISGRPQASHPLLQEPLVQEGTAGVFGFWRVEALSLEPQHLMKWLLSLNEESLKSDAVLLSDDFRFWRAAARLVWQILIGEFFLPRLEQKGGPARAVWRSIQDAPGIAENFLALSRAMPPSCFSSSMDPSSMTANTTSDLLLTSFLDRLVDSEVRGAAGGGPLLRPNHRAAGDFWLAGLTAPNSTLRIAPQEASVIESTIASWTRRLQAASGGGLRVCLRLSPPAESDSKAKRWRLDYLLQASADPSLLVPAEEVWSHGDAALALRTFSAAHPEERLLTALEAAGRVFPPIEKSLREEHPDHITLTSADAYSFLKHAAPLLSEMGFGVFLPSWWKAEKMKRLTVKLRVRPKKNETGQFGMNSLLDFDWRLALGDHTLSAKEFEDLSQLKVPLAQIRGQWVEVNPGSLKQAKAYWDRQKGNGLNLGEVFQRIAPNPKEDPGLEIGEIHSEGWIGDLMKGTTHGHTFKALDVPKTLVGKLRPYQERGLSWLGFMSAHGFGSCLADDMGLGKTVQALSYLLREKEGGRLHGPALLFCPTSVAGNWLKEAEQFAPSLRVKIHQGTKRTKDEKQFLLEVEEADLVVSTYALARIDRPLFSCRAWTGIILDEAQNVKNPLSLQSVAVRGLKSGFRMALTGTPVENHLSDLWSIMEFLNPGYLGSFSQFQQRFVVPIEHVQDQRAAEALRQMVQPFILRRLKTDPTVITDLPKKMEMKVYCTLTPEQATLYRAVVKDMMEKIETAEGISRRGMVLSALTKLKQVLNHPAHFLKDNSVLDGRSGKLDRVTEMLEEALSEGDSALVFTQYREMGELLRRHFQQKLLQPTLFFHGGLSKPRRDEMLERFQSGQERLMVLTLKAGGVGLNLTRANHVFHFDRWWNPAVENQATDRAFRIGQTKNVQVHKLVCLGTLEERISAMIDSKMALTETVLKGGESWLTELSNTQLRQIFELRTETFNA